MKFIICDSRSPVNLQEILNGPGNVVCNPEDSYLYKKGFVVCSKSIIWSYSAFYSCTATSVIQHSCLPHSTLLPVPTSPRWVTTCKELIALLVPIWTLQTEVKTALCKLNDTVLGELGKELQTQIKWPNITDYQVTHIPSLPPPA